MTDAEHVLLSFMREMKVWEEKFHRLYQEPGGVLMHVDSARAELQLIQKAYLTDRERKTGKLAAPGAGYPPEFDPDAEKVVSVDTANPRKIVIETLWTHPLLADSTRKNRYTLVSRQGRVLLDKKESFRSYRNAWESIVF